MLKTVDQICAESKWDKHTVYRLAARAEDPLPLRYLKGTRKYGRVVESEFEEWWLRNSVQYRERKSSEQ